MSDCNRNIWWVTVRDSLVAQMVKNLPAMQKTQVWSLGQEDPLEMKMATHSRTLAWKIPWTEEPGGATVHGVAKSKTWLSNFTFFHFLVIGKACVNLEIQWWRCQALFSCLIDVRMPTDGREAGRAWCAQDCMGWGRARGTKRTPDGHAANPDLGGQGRLPYVVTSGLKGKQWGVSAPDTYTHTHTHTHTHTPGSHALQVRRGRQNPCEWHAGLFLWQLPSSRRSRSQVGNTCVAVI